MEAINKGKVIIDNALIFFFQYISFKIEFA